MDGLALIDWTADWVEAFALAHWIAIMFAAGVAWATVRMVDLFVD